MIRSFFVPFHFQLLFSFASHLNCMVSSFEFLLSVSKHETDCRLVGYEPLPYSLRLFCQHFSCLTHI